jgi:hypothetical protein
MVIFSVRCNSRIRHSTKNRILPIFCAVSDTAVASDTENHIHVNRPLNNEMGDEMDVMKWMF